jgi:hypothetical protein
MSGWDDLLPTNNSQKGSVSGATTKKTTIQSTPILTRPTTASRHGRRIISSVSVLRKSNTEGLYYDIKVSYTNGDGEILYSVRPSQVKSLFSQTKEEIPEKIANEIESYENEVNEKFERESGIINRKKKSNEDAIYEITILKQTSNRPPAFNVKLLYKYGDIKEMRNVNPDDLSNMYFEASLPIPNEIKDIIDNYVSTNYQFSVDDTREKTFFP